MDETEQLRNLYPLWLQRITQSLGKGTGVRDDLKTQLTRFFELLVQAMETGDPAWLDAVLSDWTSSLTETELDNGTSSVSPFIREIMQETWQVCRETLNCPQALELTTGLLPAFSYAFEKVAYLESQVRVNYVSKQLSQIRSSLERLDQSKSDFIAVAAHELRTPLTLIEGYGAMLHDFCISKNADGIEQELLNGISSGAHRLQTIIDDMIDVSLIDNNLMQLNFQPVWINRLFQTLQSELEAASSERSQQLRFVDFQGNSEMIFADSERLMQVFRNILTNAIKYTPDGGMITVNGRQLPGFIEVIIQDTGIGINPEDQGIIFEKFTRLGSISLHSSGKTKFKGGGPGLGLHIARGIIEAHGGAIWVESPGHDEVSNPGSTFHILLPIRSSPPDSRLASLLSPLISTKITEGNNT